MQSCWHFAGLWRRYCRARHPERRFIQRLNADYAASKRQLNTVDIGKNMKISYDTTSLNMHQNFYSFSFRTHRVMAMSLQLVTRTNQIDRIKWNHQIINHFAVQIWEKNERKNEENYNRNFIAQLRKNWINCFNDFDSLFWWLESVIYFLRIFLSPQNHKNNISSSFTISVKALKKILLKKKTKN